MVRFSNYKPAINFRAISYIGYFTLRGAKSQDNYHGITPVCFDICPPNISVDNKKKPAEESQFKSLIFSSLLFYMEEKQTRCAESRDSDIKKLIANAVPESTKKSTKYAANVFDGEESYE